MNQSACILERLSVASVALLLGIFGHPAIAQIDGITGPTFDLTAKEDYISTADGNTILAWGYANGNGTMQYPGPTLIVNQGDVVTVTLHNALPPHGADAPLPVSIVFPGQEGVTAGGGKEGLLTREADIADNPATPENEAVVTYTFTASRPGTYLYHAGTRMDLEVEMGLMGALIVRPNSNNQAYGHPDSAFDQEYLFLLSEMDPTIHRLVEAGRRSEIDTAAYHPVHWFINGRNNPDTMLKAGNETPWLPTQPYNCLPRMHPGEKLLLRIINGGRDLHPFHHHGNNSWLIARDGRLLESASGTGPDLAVSDYTITTAPGETYDAIFEWTGKGLGWDIYGHQPGDPLQPNEYAPDHGKPLPVALPDPQLAVTIGEFWSGSPYLGQFGILPPGAGGKNLNAGYFHMWHSHTERELTNDDIFPGGMMTMVIIEPPGVPIP
ncbi:MULTISPECIES: multicopper oxidase domain-containing protein [Methylocaldum]|jgi:FtsP/CotA-like multicopper oxidase with cupredoxin domain|uniref:multicopper oxidase domain-containing protein n=1 Tax=unclassified Methylocaldum TaxID=2622260 RepID=UPI000A3236E1|nr:multicopper oxidase domain-containing protein [Methylocaldum sp. RMAD-M]MBP1152241.1 FtsP/CotA-like multicopper oxidase with cupredoxin domain [Methylocaldum sp. RMAD-M]